MKYFSLIFGLLLLSCYSQVDLSEQSKQEIREAEAAFSQMALEEGISKAFISFAAETAVIERSHQLIRGLDSIKAHFASPTPAGTKLEWTPDFVDASAAGDLGYTYGKFVYTSIDSTGNPQQVKGIFHTVWKKQEDGSWKYVWD